MDTAFRALYRGERTKARERDPVKRAQGTPAQRELGTTQGRRAWNAPDSAEGEGLGGRSRTAAGD
eukprot:7046175-Alexandrium_andersonii.AAC.1